MWCPICKTEQTEAILSYYALMQVTATIDEDGCMQECIDTPEHYDDMDAHECTCVECGSELEVEEIED